MSGQGGGKNARGTEQSMPLVAFTLLGIANQKLASTPMEGSRGNMLMPLRVGGVLS